MNYETIEMTDLATGRKTKPLFIPIHTAGHTTKNKLSLLPPLRFKLFRRETANYRKGSCKSKVLMF